MKRLQTVLIFLLTSIALVCPAQQGKLKRELSKLPPAVRKAIRQKLGDAKFAGVEKNTADGETTYDVEIVRDGQARGFTLDGDGNLIDEEVFLNELPAAVQQAIQKQAAGATVDEIDKSVEDGTVTYDVEAISGVKTNNFTIDDSGQLMDTQVALADLPAHLQTAIQKEAGDRKVGEIKKAFDEGEVSYEVEMIGDGKTNTLTFDSAGERASEAQAVTLSDTPDAVQKQIKSFIGTGAVDGITKISEDHEVSYDVDVNTGGEHKTISVAQDGKILKDDDSK